MGSQWGGGGGRWSGWRTPALFAGAGAAICLLVLADVHVGMVLALVLLAAVFWLVAADSGARGRSRGWWLFISLALAPVGLPAFLLVALLDRRRGRAGLEARWPPQARPAVLAAIALLVAATLLLITNVSVPSQRIVDSAGSGTFGGRCGPTLEIGAGSPLYRRRLELSAFEPREFQEAEQRVAAECDAKAGRHLVGAAVLLGSGLLLLLASGRPVDMSEGPSRWRGARRRARDSSSET